MLWEALNASIDDDVPFPLYAHLPLLVNEQRKKLSKRRDPVSTESYRNEGYLSSAFVNYLALLGWSPRGDEEIVPLATLIEQFRLEDVSHSPAFFDVKKLRHMNGEYLRALSPEEFLDASAPWVRSVAHRLATQRSRAVLAARSVFDPSSSPRWRRSSKSGSRCSARSPAWSSSSSWTNRATTRRPSPR